MSLRLSLLALCCLSVASAGQTIHEVPTDFATIQAALASSAVLPGDVIEVRPDSENGGPYSGPIDFGGKEVTLRSALGPAVTTIDGLGNGSVVRFNSGEGPGAVLQGFLITGGVSFSNGGGIDVSSSSPTILDNHVAGNVVTNHGGGLTVRGGSAAPVVRGNHFEDNESLSYAGGGLSVRGGTPLIEDNLFEGNRADFGGGIACDGGAPQILRNSLIGNQARHGGAIHVKDGTPTIAACLMQDNQASQRGGAVYTDESIVIEHCTIVDNAATGATQGYGGGVFAETFSTPLLRNTLVWANDAGVSGGDVYGGGLSYDHCLVGKPLGGTTTHFDPGFVDEVGGDFHLERWSRCINRGSAAASVSADRDGVPVPTHGRGDIGCFEFDGTPTLAADATTLDEGLGGQVAFQLDLGSSHAGRSYVLLASATGTLPGSTLPAGLATLPLNWDVITTLVVDNLNGAQFQDFMRPLDGLGQGQALLDTLGPLPPGSSGATLTFAAALTAPFDTVTNPVQVLIQ